MIQPPILQTQRHLFAVPTTPAPSTLVPQTFRDPAVPIQGGKIEPKRRVCLRELLSFTDEQFCAKPNKLQNDSVQRRSMDRTEMRKILCPARVGLEDCGQKLFDADSPRCNGLKFSAHGGLGASVDETEAGWWRVSLPGLGWSHLSLLPSTKLNEGAVVLKSAFEIIENVKFPTLRYEKSTRRMEGVFCGAGSPSRR